MPHADLFPPISVVLCTRDRPDSLGQTLQSLAGLDYPQLEVVVVDQSGGPDTRDLVGQLGRPWLRYVHLDEPGLSRAYNAGVAAAAFDLLAFTDDDVVVPADWLRNVAVAFAKYPQVGLLYGQVLLPPQMRHREAVEGVTPALPIPRRRLLDRAHGFQVFGMGANFAARRQLFERVGGFDEVLGGGGPLESSQDFDFVYRVYQAGETTLLEPDVLVYHYGFRPLAEWPATMRSYGIGVGGFFSKHVRMGDAYAAWLFSTFLAMAGGRAVKRLLSRRSPQAEWAFFASMLSGARRSFAFPIDRRLRVYGASPGPAAAGRKDSATTAGVR